MGFNTQVASRKSHLFIYYQIQIYVLKYMYVLQHLIGKSRYTYGFSSILYHKTDYVEGDESAYCLIPYQCAPAQGTLSR